MPESWAEIERERELELEMKMRRLALQRKKKSTERKPKPICEWIEEKFIDPTSVNVAQWDFSNARLLKLEKYQRRILRHCLTPNEEGYFPYRTYVWSQIKKSGKTTTAGAVGAWFAAEVEPPNLIICAANDEEQSAGRIFAAMAPTVYKETGEFPIGKTSKPEIRLSLNGTVIKAIPNNYAGEAGANYGLTLWSELWAFESERARRLYDELIPVPTRKNSIRWVETYAGFEDESHLLLDLFLKIFTDTTEAELQPGARRVPGLEDLPCFEVPAEGLFVFWDHERRMPWQRGEAGDRYYREIQATERKSVYYRLCENRWQKSEGGFIEDHWWKRSLRLDGPQLRPMVFAVDASQRNDTTVLIGVYREDDGSYSTGYFKCWDPKGRDINLRETVGAEIEQLYDLGMVDGPIWYDPFQLHQLMMDLRDDGIECEEFNQGTERTKADTFLYKQYKNDNINNFDDPDLGDHVKGAKAKELDDEHLRIVKGTLSTSSKVDGAVAQSMAAWKCSILDLEEDQGDPMAGGEREAMKNFKRRNL